MSRPMLNQRQHLVLGRPPGRVYEPPSPALCSVRQAPGWRPLSRAHYGDATRVAHLRVARLRAFRRPWLQHAGHRCSRSLPRPAECSANAGCHPQARRRAAHLGRGPVLGRERKLCLKVAIGDPGPCADSPSVAVTQHSWPGELTERSTKRQGLAEIVDPCRVGEALRVGPARGSLVGPARA